MQKWEYLVRQRRINGDPSTLWDKKHAYPDGKTETDLIQLLGEEGWELVSVTPITSSSMWQYAVTKDLVFTFKRPKL